MKINIEIDIDNDKCNSSYKIEKLFTFDFSIKKLEETYCKETGKLYTSAYNDVERFLLKNGFVHDQGSGYVSKDKLENIQVSKFLRKIDDKFPWFVYSLKSFKIGDKPNQLFDAMEFYKKDEIIQERQKNLLKKMHPVKNVKGKPYGE